MEVTRLHAKLFEAAALDLDRKIRAQFVGENVRPQYLQGTESELKALAGPHFKNDLYALGRFVDGGTEVTGRFRPAKRVVRRLLRPFLHHHSNLHRMQIARLSELHDILTQFVGVCQDMHASLREDAERQAERVRAELVDEFRRWRAAGEFGGPGAGAAPPIPAGSKLLLGSVTVRRPGYVHIDPSAGPLDRLPVEPGTAAEVIAANVLERFPAAEVRDRLLPYWASLLQPGGRLTVIADDLEAAGDRFRDGQIDFSELAEVLFGGGGAVRRSAFTPDQLCRYVSEAGLTDVAVNDRRQRPDLGAYGFELAAYRAAA